MRKTILGTACFVTMITLSGAAFAESAPNELTMTIFTKGEVHSAPDKITMGHEFSESGSNEKSVRAALNAHLDSVKKKLAELNLGTYTADTGDIKISNQASLTDMMKAAGNAKSIKALDAAGANTVFAKASIKVVFHDVTKLAGVKSALEVDDSPTSWMTGGANPFQTPYELIDDSKARVAAVADAFAKAKVEADLYAKQMGYHIVRIKNFGNDAQLYNMNDFSNMGNMIGKMMPIFGAGTPDITTYANIKIEYIVAPN